jgi:hypothetical protein
MSGSGAGSGTQSPPLEATGEHKPMGATSVNAVSEGTSKIEAVSDSEQRKSEPPFCSADGKMC